MKTFLTFCFLLALAPSIRAGGLATVLETKVISQQPEYYHGWPTVTRRADGELWLVCSGGRETHVCPFGQVVAMASRDNGETWSWPRVLLDSAIDDRDTGVLETAKGTLLVTTFSSLAYEPHFKKDEVYDEIKPITGWTTKPMSEEQRVRWQAAHDRSRNDEERKAELGMWMLRSTDGGRSWSTRYSVPLNSPHGPIQLTDGRLLYAGKQLWSAERKTGVCESTDDGLTWQWLGEIPAREGDDAGAAYHELHAVEAADGTIIAHIRSLADTNRGWTLQTESRDGGKTWSVPHPVCYGMPSHLLRLRDGRLVMTYSHRREPYGCQARISKDHGRTWGKAIVLSGDGMSADLGYPSTVELGDGVLLTVWYENTRETNLAVLRQAKWKLGGGDESRPAPDSSRKESERE